MDESERTCETRAQRFWAANLRLTLAIWFTVSFGFGILLRGVLDRYSLGGAPLGLWFAQQGSIYVFVILTFVYCIAMRRLERRHLGRGN